MTAAVDEKAGYCTNCRAGSHALCGSAKCACPDMRRHRNRPGFAGQATTGAPVVAIERARRASPPADKDRPTFRLERKDPPAPPPKPRKPTLADHLLPLLADIPDDSTDWWSVAVCVSQRGAGQMVGRCRNKLGIPGWEWKAVDGEVYVRRAKAGE